MLVNIDRQYRSHLSYAGLCPILKEWFSRSVIWQVATNDMYSLPWFNFNLATGKCSQNTFSQTCL